MHKFGTVQQKILLSLLGGIALGASSSPRQYYRTLKGIYAGWKKVDQRSFNRSIKKLSSEKLVEERNYSDGSLKLILTEKGRREAKVLDLLGNSIGFKKPKRWDGKWRIVFFDIPERSRIFRDILREHLYNLDFYKLQQSVFVSPYPFEKQLLELIALYSAQPYVRVATATKIDSEKKIKGHFFKNVST